MTAVCWVRDVARFEEREGEHWIPMRASQSGFTVHLEQRRYSGCLTGYRGDTGRTVRVGAADLFDVITVEARRHA